MIIIIIAYTIIALIATCIEYKTVKKDCDFFSTPNIDYCLIRGFFFPFVIIKKVFDYVINE